MTELTHCPTPTPDDTLHQQEARAYRDLLALLPIGAMVEIDAITNGRFSVMVRDSRRLRANVFALADTLPEALAQAVRLCEDASVYASPHPHGRIT